MPLAEVQKRLNELCSDLPPSLGILSSERLTEKGERLNIGDAQHRKRLTETLELLRDRGQFFKVIILDNLSALSSGIDENDNSAQDDILQWMIGLRHAGYTVVLIHHAGKSGQKRGASRREDILDTSIKLELPKEEDGVDRTGRATFIFSFTKTRGKSPVPDKLLLRLREDKDGQLTFQFEKSVAAAPRFKTLYLIAGGVAKPSGALRPFATQREITEAARVSKGTISKHVTALVEERLLFEAPNGYLVTPEGAKKLKDLFGTDVAKQLTADHATQNEIPF